MAREVITIVVQERGTRIVNRRLRRTADAASVAARSIQLLRKALVLFASAVLLQRLFQLVDAFTQLTNRLRLVTSSMSELRSTTEAVLEISNRTRTAFDANAEVFTRVSLSVKDLGASSQDVITFMENLNKAIIVSGATATEASAGIIQLTQGLASDRLSGDELRSVLEQLPRVAQLLSDSLDVGRGKLRELGEEGQLTGEVLFDAILNATEELDGEFDQIERTIGQAFTVFRNNIIATIGDLNRLVPLASALSGAILLLANSLRTVAFGALVSATVLVAANFQTIILAAGTLTRVLDVLGVRTLVRLRAKWVGVNAAMAKHLRTSVVLQAKGVLPLTAAFAFLRNVVIGTNAALTANILTVEGLKTVYAQATIAANGLSAALVRVGVALKAVALAAKANPFLIVATGVVVVIGFLAKFRNEIKLQGKGITTLGDLVKAVFDNIKTSLTFLKDTAESFFPSLNLSLEGIFNFIGRAIVEIMLALATAADTVTGIFVGLYRGVEALSRGLVAIVGDIILSAVNLLIGGFEDFANTLISIGNVVRENLRTPINFFLRTLAVGFNSVGRAVAASINFIASGINDVIDGAVSGINRMIEGVNNLLRFLGRAELDDLGALDIGEVTFTPVSATTVNPGDLTQSQLDLDRVTNPFAGAGSDAADLFIDSFVEGFTAQTTVTEAVLALLDQANENALDRQRQANEERIREQQAIDLLRQTSFQEQFNLINEEIGLLVLSSEEREYQNRLNEIKNTLIEEGVVLEDDASVALLAQLEVRLRQLEVVKATTAALDNVRGITLDLRDVQAELNRQVELGLITVEQSTRAYNLLRDAVNESQISQKGLTQAVVDGINDEIRLLRVSASEREAQSDADQAAAAITNDLRRAGIVLTQKETDAISAGLLPLQQELVLLQQVADALDGVQASTINLAGAKEELARRVEEEGLSAREAADAYRTLRIAANEANKDAASGAERSLDKYQEKLEDLAGATESLITGAFQGMEDALVSFVTTGELSFANFANSIIQDLARIAIQQAILGPLLGVLTGNPFTPGTFGARALGGPVTGGQPYLVGERGPELFVPPTGGGSIEPNTGQGGGNVRIINVVDPAAMSDYLASSEGERIVVNHINRNPSAVRRAAGG